jgi:hypothetical protein
MDSPLDRAVTRFGLQPLARELGVTYQAVRKWQKRGRMPRTEYSGETEYCKIIERLSGGEITERELLAMRPVATEAA